jgi:hypothetical protein
MRKIMFKTICIFTLVFFVMSMTGAACGNGNSCNKKTDAIKDSYSFKLKSCPKVKYCFGTVLKNDKGCSLKVTTTGTITTKKGGTVTMKSNGTFCYKPSSACRKESCTDSFKYTAKGKDGKSDTTSVTLKMTCPSC